MSSLKVFSICLIVVGLMGCEAVSTPSTVTPSPTPSSITQVLNTPDTTPAIIPVATPTPSPTVTPDSSIQLTYYSLTSTRTPRSAQYPSGRYTATGYCVVYLANTYCWDDGIKTLVLSGFNFTFTYWNVSRDTVGWSFADGGLNQDLMAAPTQMTFALTNNLPTNSIQNVLTTGTAKTVTCTESHDVLDCIDFQINLKQVLL